MACGRMALLAKRPFGEDIWSKKKERGLVGCDLAHDAGEKALHIGGALLGYGASCGGLHGVGQFEELGFEMIEREGAVIGGAGFGLRIVAVVKRAVERA